MQKTYKRRVAAWLLAAAMAFGLAGCEDSASVSSGASAANPTPDVSASGSWQEADVTPSQSARSFEKPVLLEDGSLLLLEKKNDGPVSLWSSADNGASWQEMSNDWLEQTGADYIGLTKILPDGGCFLTAVSGEGTSRSWTCWVQDAGASALRQITLPQSIEEITDFRPVTGQTAIMVCMVLTQATEDAPPALLEENGMMHVMSVWQLDLATGSCTEMPEFTQTLGSSVISGMAPDPTQEGAFYYIRYQESGTSLMRGTLDGVVNTAFENLPDASEAAYAACSDSQGNYYYASGKGIYRIAKGGDLAELVVDGSGTAMQKTNVTMMGLSYCADGSFLLSLFEQQSNADGSEEQYTLIPHIYRYYWDADAVVPEKTASLTVWGLESSDTVRAAITAYEAMYPDRTVDYQVALDTGVTRADALTSLNTALLAGSGPDVLLLDGMDWEAYRDKGLLADLTGYVDPASLKANLVAPFLEEDGSACVLPARFAIPVLCGEKETLSGLTSLSALADQLLAMPARPAFDCQSADYYETLDQPYGLGFISTEQLLNFALESSAPALVSNGVDGAAVSAVLDFVAKVGGYYGMDQYAGFLSNGVVAGGSTGEAVAYSDGGYECFFTHNAAMAWDTMLSPAYVATVLDDEPSFTVVSRPGLTQDAFLPKVMAGISASSDAPEQAGEFLAVLFGSDVQTTWQQDGMPVRSDALEESVARSCSGEALDLVTDLIDSLQTPVTLPGDTVYDVLLTSANALVAGNMTLEQAQAEVEDALRLYLAEQA